MLHAKCSLAVWCSSLAHARLHGCVAAWLAWLQAELRDMQRRLPSLRGRDRQGTCMHACVVMRACTSGCMPDAVVGDADGAFTARIYSNCV